MTTVKELGFALLIVCVQCVGAEAKCSLPTFEGFGGDQAVDARLVLSSGAHCTVQLKYSAGPTYGFQTVQPPSHGSVSVGNNRITYRSRSGYIGADLFVFETRGETLYGTPRKSTIRIHVTVTAP
jgi:hypothetical protein